MSVSVPGPRSTTDPATPFRKTHSRAGGFRPEVEGLRAVAVLLVAIHHIWFGRVSGGVDVFLLLTGFFITGSLLRSVGRHGRVMFWQFWTRLARRLIPMAAVCLVGIMAATFVFLPRSRWQEILAEVRAAALYHQNWELAEKAVDYLAREEAIGPVQHFWSLSIQGQFYVVWPLLFAVAAFVAARRRWSLHVAVGAVVAGVGLVSLAHSVHVTDQDQAWAYFDTGARLWEFALGGLLALVIDRVVLPGRLRVLLGWVGLVGLVSCGMVLQVSTMFPGWVALWPTSAAMLVIVAGTTGSRFGADRLLTWGPLMALGRLSYGLYLWHWPVLVCWLHVTDRFRAGVVDGVLVLSVSLVLAWCSHRWVESLTKHPTHLGGRGSPARSLGVATAFLVPVLLLTGLWEVRGAEERRARSTQTTEADHYPGAAAADPRRTDDLPEAPVLPDPADAHEDLPHTHELGCHVSGERPLNVCEEGPDDAEHTLALVGASRMDHWYPAVVAVAEEQGWKLLTFTRSGCLLDVEGLDDGNDPDCRRWNEQVMDTLKRLRPDAVVTSSTRTRSHGKEYVPDGYLQTWKRLDDLGIDVIGLRDLPRRETSGADCVADGPPEECVESALRSLSVHDPAARNDLPDNVTLVDLTEAVCPEGRCEAVVGNVLVFWDHSHLTATYARTLAPQMGRALTEATGW